MNFKDRIKKIVASLGIMKTTSLIPSADFQDSRCLRRAKAYARIDCKKQDSKAPGIFAPLAEGLPIAAQLEWNLNEQTHTHPKR